MIVILNKIADIVIGYQSKTRVYENANGLFRLVQGKDFNSTHCLREESLLSFVPDRNPNLYLVHRGDVLFQARGTEHFAYYLEKELANTLASSSFYIIKLNTKQVIPEYLSWFLNQRTAQAYFNAHASSTAISFISKQILLRLELKIPPIIIQEKICQTIKLWEREINLRNELIKKRKQLINGLCLKTAQQK